MSKFKAGDVVVVIEVENGCLEVGDVCIVAEYNCGKPLVQHEVSTDEWNEWVVDDHKLELYKGSKASGSIYVSSELTNTINLHIINDEYEITVEEARDLIGQLQGELNE